MRNNPEVKLYKMCFRGQGQSFESEKYTSQNEQIPPLKWHYYAGLIYIVFSHDMISMVNF